MRQRAGFSVVPCVRTTFFFYCYLLDTETCYKNAHARGNTRTNKSPHLNTMAGKLLVSLSYGFELTVVVAHCFRTEKKYTLARACCFPSFPTILTSKVVKVVLL